MYENQLSFTHRKKTLSFNYTMLILVKSYFSLFTVQVNDVKSLKGDFLDYSYGIVSFLCIAPLCIVLWKNRLKGGACHDLEKNEQKKQNNPHIVNSLCRERDKRASVVSRQQWEKKKKHNIKTSDAVASCEW